MGLPIKAVRMADRSFAAVIRGNLCIDKQGLTLDRSCRGLQGLVFYAGPTF